ncbi:hypothetical protein [Lysobacter antibioticus]|uniref:hypothetical protein n=1 Tax=Lysobacter antibioticus TaxID=84531 RepID=UPI00034C25B1|nr:hypothetical protein [Lysobacter antibioticus]
MANNDPRSEDYAWSIDEERFDLGSFGEALDALESDGRLAVGQVIYYGETEQQAASSFVPTADQIIDCAADNAYDHAGEHSEGFGNDVTPEAKAELNAFLSEWANKNMRVHFWLVRNVRKYIVTAEDVSAWEG